MDDKINARNDIIKELQNLQQEYNSLKQLYINDITRYKQSEILLKESEENYRYLFFNNPQPMWIYSLETLAFLEINNAAIQHYGYTREEFLSMTLKDIRPKEDINAMLKDVELTQLDFNHAGEWRHIKKNGELIHVEIISHSITFNNHKARHVMVNDITRQKKVEEQLHKLSQAVEQSSTSIILTDSEGTIEYANPKVLEISGYELDELVGENPRIFSSGEKSKSEYKVLWETISSGKEWRGEFHNKKKNGQLYWEIAQISPILNKKGTITHYLAVRQDITELKQAENNLKAKNQELEKLNIQKDKFFSIIAHDLRSPFNGFLGLTKIIAEEISSLESDEIQKMGETMWRSANNFFKLLENLLQWSQMEQGLISYNPVSLNLLSFVVENLVTELETSENKGITVRNDIPDEIFVLADVRMFRSIISNLFSNSTKFTPNGGKIVISAKPAALNKIEISIKDTGIGMSEAIQNRLFRLNEQINRKGTDGELSTGLGLFLCKDFIEKHGGTIWVKSEEGKGSTFCFTIPSITKLPT